MWQSCATCGIRLRYVPKGNYHGETRAVGPPRDLVLQAQDELREEFNPTEMTERIFNAKLMEVKGRTLVANRGRGRMSVQIRADEELGQLMMGETVETKPKGYQEVITPTPKAKAPSAPKALKDLAASSESGAIPPGTTVQSMQKTKGVKIKAEPVEQSAHVTPGTQSVPVVMVDAETILVTDSEEEQFQKLDSKEKAG